MKISIVILILFFSVLLFVDGSKSSTGKRKSLLEDPAHRGENQSRSRHKSARHIGHLPTSKISNRRFNIHKQLNSGVHRHTIDNINYNKRSKYHNNRLYKRTRANEQLQDNSFEGDLSSDIFGFSKQDPIRMDMQQIDDKTPIGRALNNLDPFSDSSEEPDVNQYVSKQREEQEDVHAMTDFDVHRPLQLSLKPTIRSYHHRKGLSPEEKNRMKLFLHATSSDTESKQTILAYHKKQRDSDNKPTINPFSYLNLPETQSVEIQPTDTGVSLVSTKQDNKDSVKINKDPVTLIKSTETITESTNRGTTTKKVEEKPETTSSSVIEVKEMPETPNAFNRTLDSNLTDSATTTIDNDSKQNATITELPFVITKNTESPITSKKKSTSTSPSTTSTSAKTTTTNMPAPAPPQQTIDIKDSDMHLSLALNSSENEAKYIEKLENVIKLVKGIKKDATFVTSTTSSPTNATKKGDKNATISNDDSSYIMHQGNLYKVVKLMTGKDQLEHIPTAKLNGLDDQLSKMVEDTAHQIQSTAKSMVITNDYLARPNYDTPTKSYTSSKISPINEPMFSKQLPKEDKAKETKMAVVKSENGLQASDNNDNKLLSENDEEESLSESDASDHERLTSPELLYEDDDNQSEKVPEPKKTSNKKNKSKKKVKKIVENDDDESEAESGEKSDDKSENESERIIDEEEDEDDEEEKKKKKKKKVRKLKKKKEKKKKSKHRNYYEDDEGSGEDQMKKKPDMSIHMLHKTKEGFHRQHHADVDTIAEFTGSMKDLSREDSSDEEDGGDVVAELLHHHHLKNHHHSNHHQTQNKEDDDEEYENESESGEENVGKKKNFHKHILNGIKEGKMKPRHASFFVRQNNHQYQVNLRALDKTADYETPGEFEENNIKRLPDRTRVFAERIPIINTFPNTGYAIRTFIDPQKHTKTFEIRHNDRFYRVVQPVEIADKRGIPSGTDSILGTTSSENLKPTMTEMANIELPDVSQNSLQQEQPFTILSDPSSKNVVSVNTESETAQNQSPKEITLEASPVKTSSDVGDVIEETKKRVPSTDSLTLLESPPLGKYASTITAQPLALNSLIEGDTTISAPVMAHQQPHQQQNEMVHPEQVQPSMELTKQVADLGVHVYENKHTLLGTRKEKVPAANLSASSNNQPLSKETPASSSFSNTPTDASATLSREIKGVTSLSSDMKATKRQPTSKTVNEDFTKALDQDIVLK